MFTIGIAWCNTINVFIFYKVNTAGSFRFFSDRFHRVKYHFMYERGCVVKEVDFSTLSPFVFGSMPTHDSSVIYLLVNSSLR